MIKNCLLFIFIVLGVISSKAQKDSTKTKVKSIKPLRLGVKVGVPSILTVNAEYVTPLLQNRVAVFGDYMALSKTIEEEKADYTNYEVGANIYLNSKGKGLYLGVSYFSFDSNILFSEVEFESSYEDVTGNFKFNTTNVKIGAKFGRTFYFRIEAGYAFGDIPEYIVLTSSSGEKAIEEIPDIPGITSSGLPVFNFGIGFSFL